jgi:inorganic pyrophosphatase
MVDGGESDAKILAVPCDDPRFKEVTDLADVNKHTLKEITHFFLTYKTIQNKEVTLGEWGGKTDAEAAFTRSRELYDAKKS